MLELETPVELIVESITLFFVMNGDHSMDNRILISPVLHEYIRMLGKQAGINVVDGLNDDEDTELTTNKFKAEKLREEIDRLRDTEEDDGGVDLMEQTAELLEGQEEETDDIMEADMPIEEPPMTDELPEQMPSTEMMPNMDQGQGIMARRE